MTKTLVIINPHAGGKRALAIWEQIQHYLRDQLGDVTAVITQYAEDVPNCLKQSSEEGFKRVIAIGGDGTNHHVVNAVVAHNAQYPDEAMTFATLPAGTGRDWARGAGMPLDVKQAVDWIKNTRPRPIDLGHALLDGKPHHFLNVSSVGISNDIVQRVENAPKGGSTTFIKAILNSLLHYEPEHVKVYLDGKEWWDAPAYIVAVANGKYFGQGLYVAPNASIDDGYFEVMVAQKMNLPRILQVVAQLYKGTHIYNPRVKVAQAQEVRVVSQLGHPIGLDLDGEGAHATEIVYSVKPKILMMNT
jgi:YegS/Rv2252/BmrU family lipid kinase